MTGHAKMGNPVAILGGKGMLGSDLVAACEQRGLACVVYDLPEFDITDEAALAEVVASAGAVVNCAAYTNVDRAESERDLARRINADAVGTLARLCRQQDTYLLHISTDFVFDGQQESPYRETDDPRPINVYGQTKLDGERLLQQANPAACVVRVQWTYGHGGANFITKIIAAGQTRPSLTVIDDQIGAQTSTREVAEALLVLLEKQPAGVFHFAADGFASRFEVAQTIFAHLGRDIEILPCQSSAFETPAQRPLNSRFDCSKIQALLPAPILPWQEPLKQFLSERDNDHV
ncbi:MAG: dTDP-4-dehydrorhamnose reductase [Phycisphaerales bacterium]|jgi:dTDP-4-dehydrorhamnose reductase|nr:dTDP-4-dehydrorhamnose reductase [Phycisphaerales bacterium]MBT7170921.1 dTDP-4-dehydrorhamnose reductase [Phycisphaerales bacterium]